MRYSPRKVLIAILFFTVVSLMSIGLIDTASVFIIIYGIFVTYKTLSKPY